MEKFIIKETIHVTGDENDCDYCVFNLKCINQCRLPIGKHYELNPKYKGI